AVLFLNHEWVRHVVYDAPNVLGVSWRFKHANASKLLVSSELTELLGEKISKTVATPIKFSIGVGPFKPAPFSGGNLHLYPSKPLVTNAIGEVFGQQVLFDSASMWILPGFANNSRVMLRLMGQLDRLREGSKQALSTPVASKPS